MAERRAGIRPSASVWLASSHRPRPEQVGGPAHEPPRGSTRKVAPAGLDRDRIVAAAIRLLDTEGIAKFSMRRLAAELGVSAMSVYWHVDNKDDLLELVLDAVYGEVPLPDPDSERDWRDDLRMMATGLREVLVAHPWAPRLVGEYLNIGPNAVEMSAATRRVLSHTGLPRELLAGALGVVFHFVLGFGTVEGRWVGRCAETGLSQDELYETLSPRTREAWGYAEPHDPAGGGEESAGRVERLLRRDFAFALDCLIAGLEVMSGSRSKG